MRTIELQPIICIIFMVCIGAGLTSFAYYESPEQPLTATITRAAEDLTELESCDARVQYLQEWMKNNSKKLGQQKKEFDESCPFEDFVCMSYLILASARIEVSLRDCLDRKDIEAPVTELNRVAGTSVRLHDAPR